MAGILLILRTRLVKIFPIPWLHLPERPENEHMVRQEIQFVEKLGADRTKNIFMMMMGDGLENEVDPP
jgi:hypothetical protein